MAASINRIPPRGVMQDPRLRGRVNSFIKGPQPRGRDPVRGQDRNAGFQSLSAAQGMKTAPRADRYRMADRASSYANAMQNQYRNRSTEQRGAQLAPRPTGPQLGVPRAPRAGAPRPDPRQVFRPTPGGYKMPPRPPLRGGPMNPPDATTGQEHFAPGGKFYRPPAGRTTLGGGYQSPPPRMMPSNQVRNERMNTMPQEQMHQAMRQQHRGLRPSSFSRGAANSMRRYLQGRS